MPILTPFNRVVAIDLLGFGESAAPPDARFTLDEHVDALARTLDSLRLGRAALIGHSLGALVSSRYAATRGEGRVRQTVLVAPPVYPESAYLSGAGDRLRVASYLRFYRALRTDQEKTTRRLDLLARILPGPGLFIEERYWDAFAHSMQNCIETQTTITDVASIPGPVDVVYGSRDPIVLADSIERLERMRHVTVHQVPGADHIVRQAMAVKIARVLD